jgi:hypothetical protein
MTRRVILILGCHRSGTSVVARAMQCLGASFPSDLMPASPENPAGYWESAAVQKLNDYILGRCGSSWERPLEPMLLAGLNLDQERAWVAAWLKYQPDLLALKDPRMCRLLPFWRPVFAAAEVEVSVVHVLRHPMAVAQSLRKRGIPVERGLALWLEHVVRAREDVDPTWVHVTIKYEETIFAKLDWQLKATADRFGLLLDMEELVQLIHGYLNADLMHERCFDDELLPLVVRAVREFVWKESVYSA